jgi:hypothetical protein
MVKLVDPNNEWAGEIGRIVIAFGRRERPVRFYCQQRRAFGWVFAEQEGVVPRESYDGGAC